MARAPTTLGGSIRRIFTRMIGTDRIAVLQAEQRTMLAYSVWLALLQQEKYRDPRSLAPHGYKVYSQAEEDGIIHEIFRRIGVEHGSFVEIGVSNGLECNTRLLLRSGWRGCWLDAEAATEVRTKFTREIAAGELHHVCTYVTRDNCDALLNAHLDAEGLDLLSIDIDGNDYHLLDSLQAQQPRVIVLEYNPVFAPPTEWIMDYNPEHFWRGGDDYGASLKSYENLLSRKGYGLVGCTLNGNNAFFVRRDLMADHFMPDASAEFHFEPQRFWLTHAFVGGHSGAPAG